MKYSVDYFINKFQAIPESRWTTCQLIDDLGRSCAYGHCEVTTNEMGDQYELGEEGAALKKLFLSIGIFAPPAINDSPHCGYPQETPKARILAALNDIKEQSKDTKEVQPKEKIRYVSVPCSITEQTKELIMQ